MKRFVAQFAAVTVLLFVSLVVVPGCVTTQAQVDALKQTSADTQESILQLRADLAAIPPGNSAAVAKIQTELDRLAPILAEVNEKIQNIKPGDNAWLDLLEIFGIAAAGAIPGFGVAIPFIRAAKNVTKSVFASIDAGGGPTNPEAAKAVLVKDPKAYQEFLNWKAAKISG